MLGQTLPDSYVGTDTPRLCWDRHPPAPMLGQISPAPILGQNTVGKLMERIVARKLTRDLEDREVLPANQGGSDQENAQGKMQLHLQMTCTKDSR